MGVDPDRWGTHWAQIIYIVRPVLYTHPTDKEEEEEREGTSTSVTVGERGCCSEYGHL